MGPELIVDGVTIGPQPDDLFERLMPFVEHSENWAARWMLVIQEVQRRSVLMGWESAVDSVSDDLQAGRL